LHKFVSVKNLDICTISYSFSRQHNTNELLFCVSLNEKNARRSIVQAGRKRQIFMVVISYLGFVEIVRK
ncbi:hypothetical protein, partial [Proteiniphilum sp. UBA5346]